MKPIPSDLLRALRALQKGFCGELHFDDTMRTLYATDASAYRELPLAVAIPASVEDLRALIRFAAEHRTSLIPRTAGTSLAGQVVGGGIVVDVSRHFNRILSVDASARRVRVQPGVIRDDLNLHLRPYGLFFAPETSTANRAMIGGMVGNNSCGSNSVVYGSAREHLVAARALLSDGSEVEFGPLDRAAFEQKCAGRGVSGDLEKKLYAGIRDMLSDPGNRKQIEEGYPKKNIPRRNTGYALDLLMDAVPFNGTDKPFNFCTLLAGSEGTLAFLTELELNLEPLPPPAKLLVCAHFSSVIESLEANLIAIRYQPHASELIDHFILECTKNNIEQRKNRFFIEGEPGAILVIDLSRDTREEALSAAGAMIAEMKKAGLGYHYPVLEGDDTGKIWNLRKAGLGLLSNMPGDDKPVPVIEDTAVDVQELPAYIREFNEILGRYGLQSVHYAHAGSGEIHLRPILNLKTAEGTRMFRTIAEDIAALVKKYKGSLSGEHGDGRLRGEFIPFMLGPENYALIRAVKETWDPGHIFNPGKIVDTPPMDTSLRYYPGQETRQFGTVYRFDRYDGILRAAELCNGSGDCRKTELSGGTMCPSYMATRNEKDTTRARANILREVLTHSTKDNPFDSESIREVMDLCLSCKGCKSECPSNVDVAKFKGEFLQQYYDANGVPLRTKLVANFSRLNRIASAVPWAYNFAFSNPVVAPVAKRLTGFAPKRSIPALHGTTLRRWYRQQKARHFGVPDFRPELGKVLLFCDEFTNYNDVEVGRKVILLLTRLGYEVEMPVHAESGRTWISKGLLRKAKEIAEKNVRTFAPLVSPSVPLLGIEPSAILSFRDEYLDLVDPALLEQARSLADHALMLDEFLDREMEQGRIGRERFSADKKLIRLHGHCHQKSLASIVPTRRILSFPENYEVQLIPSGCCGMAGSFGYEEEHYELSMKIGELVLFPEVRKQPESVLIAAPGTSCRHQIADGTGRKAFHPAEILYDALIG
jgi:FAD/FMN-containing dehydrogenase/Fe-S oxidoreductase